MFALALTLLASAGLAAAQDDTSSSAYHTHGAFAFIRSGERTPLLTGETPVLTAVGAQQMYQLGQALRARWISSTGGDDAALGRQNIANMSVDLINNDQISVQTLDSQYLVASAQAFMQGMYPPRSIANSTGLGDSTGLLADGSTVQTPLDGYQYATVQSFSAYAYNSIYIAGNLNCPEAKLEAMRYGVSERFEETKAESQETYDLLHTSWFQGHLLGDQRDYDHALEIWDWLSYQYTHNRTIYERLTGSPLYTGVYNATRYYADEYAWNTWGNTAASRDDTDNQAIGGMTLAAEILHQFQQFVADRQINPTSSSPGVSHPLTLLFGDPDPMINLLSLLLADTHDPRFRAIPPYASAIIFELYSISPDPGFPQDTDDLNVNFYFHNGTTDFNGQLLTFPLFNRGINQTAMKWSDFNIMFSRIMMPTIAEWCATCNAPSLFCTGVDSDSIIVTAPTTRPANHYAVSPPVAGAIGALVALAVAGLLFGLAMLVGGVRFHRQQPKQRRASALGGFKGAAKLASDPDLTSLSKSGVLPAGVGGAAAAAGAGAGDGKRHERVGSWELRQKEFGPDKGADLGEAFPSPRESFERIDAVAGRPVEPRESV